MNPYRTPAPIDIHIEPAPIHRRAWLTPMRALAIAGVAVPLLTAACGYLPGDEASDAELQYRAELLRCVDRATTLQESKDCRRAVDRKFFGPVPR